MYNDAKAVKRKKWDVDNVQDEEDFFDGNDSEVGYGDVDLQIDLRSTESVCQSRKFTRRF